MGSRSGQSLPAPVRVTSIIDATGGLVIGLFLPNQCSLAARREHRIQKKNQPGGAGHTARHAPPHLLLRPRFPWAASGRAIANGRDEGVTKLLFDDSPEAGSGDGHAGRGHGKILGGGMVGTHAGDMIGEIALAIEMGADAVDIGKTIHPHPTLGESIGMAAEVAHGSCTDVPPARK
jgi:hypothetical protein